MSAEMDRQCSKKIAGCKARIAVINLGRSKTESLKQGVPCTKDTPSAHVRKLLKRRGRLDVSDHLGGSREADAAIICMPMPLNRAKDSGVGENSRNVNFHQPVRHHILTVKAPKHEGRFL
ncbi:MAG: hypothetical protein BWY44_00870 [Candidatus Omnitrophica bacterium ADurb.Bin292]|nr:MAG: hypothetical protein BWY44_00870 [Candidatus Omnitrophica bacterium ADurb.Bin292]